MRIITNDTRYSNLFLYFNNKLLLEDSTFFLFFSFFEFFYLK